MPSQSTPAESAVLPDTSTTYTTVLFLSAGAAPTAAVPLTVVAPAWRIAPDAGLVISADIEVPPGNEPESARAGAATRSDAQTAKIPAARNMNASRTKVPSPERETTPRTRAP